MEHQSPRSDMSMPTKFKKRWPLIKILICLLLTVAVFGGGVAVGRGDVQFKGLSLAKRPAPTALDYSSVDQLYSLLGNDFDGNLDAAKILDGLKAGLVDAAGDPYTQYFNPKDAQIFDEELTGSFTGIGAELGTDSNGNIVIQISIYLVVQ